MNYFLVLGMSLFVTSIIAHLYIRSYLIASITALFLGPLIASIGLYIVSGCDNEVWMWLPIIYIFMMLYSSPAPFLLGLSLRLVTKYYRNKHGVCIQCGHKMNEDITKGCTKCSWQLDCICKGLCPKCTYNLRGEFSKGCPECGWRRVYLS